MPERKEFVMTDEQLKTLLHAGRPTPEMYLSGGMRMFPTPQENVNRAWKELGEELGFEYLSVRPVEGKTQHHFTAVPTECSFCGCTEKGKHFSDCQGMAHGGG